MLAFDMVWTLVLLLASSVHVSSSSKPTSPRAQLMTGLIEGFTSQKPDLAACITDVTGDLHDLDEALRDISKHDVASIAAGLRKLADALDALPVLEANCGASKTDLIDIITTLRKIHGLKDLGTHIWEDILRNRRGIGSDVVGAAAAYQAEDYIDVGRRIGVALRLVVVGRAAPQPLPPPPKPPFNQGMQRRLPGQMVRAEPGDQIEVHWNLSPLCIEQLKSWGGVAGLFHVSVGFTNLRSGLDSTVEFAADQFDASLILPILNYSDRTVTWNNTAEVKPYEGKLDVNYWQFRTKLATINASTYNELLSWFDYADQAFKRYLLFALDPVMGEPRQNNEQDWWLGHEFGGFTCFDFAYLVIEKLAELAGPCAFDRSLPGLLRNDIVLLETNAASSQPAKPEEVFSFYEAVDQIPKLWSLNISETISEIARLAKEKVRGDAIYQDLTGQYWSYTPHRPFLSIRKRFAPLPGTCHYGDNIMV